MSDPQPAPVQLRNLSIGYRRDLPILRGRRHGLGYLAEDTAMPDGWSCDGILALAAAAAGPDADVENALRLAGVDYATDVPASKLSKGMKRRLALAVALMRPIRLLILDEPESGLDPGQRHRLRRRIETIRSTMTILVASHDLGELALMSDHVLFIDQGRGRLIEQPEDGFTRDPRTGIRAGRGGS